MKVSLNQLLGSLLLFTKFILVPIIGSISNLAFLAGLLIGSKVHRDVIYFRGHVVNSIYFLIFLMLIVFSVSKLLEVRVFIFYITFIFFAALSIFRLSPVSVFLFGSVVVAVALTLLNIDILLGFTELSDFSAQAVNNKNVLGYAVIPRVLPNATEFSFVCVVAYTALYFVNINTTLGVVLKLFFAIAVILAGKIMDIMWLALLPFVVMKVARVSRNTRRLVIGGAFLLPIAYFLIVIAQAAASQYLESESVFSVMQANGRLFIWSNSIQHFANAPVFSQLFGHGLFYGSFDGIPGLGEFARFWFDLGVDPSRVYLHSTAIQILVDFGLFGLIFFFSVIVSMAGFVSWRGFVFLLLVVFLSTTEVRAYFNSWYSFAMICMVFFDFENRGVTHESSHQ